MMVNLQGNYQVAKMFFNKQMYCGICLNDQNDELVYDKMQIAERSGVYINVL